MDIRSFSEIRSELREFINSLLDDVDDIEITLEEDILLEMVLDGIYISDAKLCKLRDKISKLSTIILKMKRFKTKDYERFLIQT